MQNMGVVKKKKTKHTYWFYCGRLKDKSTPLGRPSDRKGSLFSTSESGLTVGHSLTKREHSRDDTLWCPGPNPKSLAPALLEPWDHCALESLDQHPWGWNLLRKETACSARHPSCCSWLHQGPRLVSKAIWEALRLTCLPKAAMWVKSTECSLQEAHFKYKNTQQLKVKG